MKTTTTPFRREGRMGRSVAARTMQFQIVRPLIKENLRPGLFARIHGFDKLKLPCLIWVFVPAVDNVNYPCGKCSTIYRVTRIDAIFVHKQIGRPDLDPENCYVCDCMGSLIE